MTDEITKLARQLFDLGQCVATPGAIESMQSGPGMLASLTMLGRHATGDWGEVDAHDQEANNLAVQDGSRILSAYTIGGVKYWVITEADRSATTILLPMDY